MTSLRSSSSAFWSAGMAFLFPLQCVRPSLPRTTLLGILGYSSVLSSASMSHLTRLLAALAICLAPMAAADTTAFTPGEQVVYRASYLGIPAGTIQVTVGAEFADSPGVWPVLFVGRSDVGLFFFPIRDKLVLRWDAENVQTLGMEMWADENHKRRHLKILFDHTEGKAKVFRQADGQEPV